MILKSIKVMVKSLEISIEVYRILLSIASITKSFLVNNFNLDNRVFEITKQKIEIVGFEDV